LLNEGNDGWEKTAAKEKKRFAKNVRDVVFVNDLCVNQTFV